MLLTNDKKNLNAESSNKKKEEINLTAVSVKIVYIFLFTKSQAFYNFIIKVKQHSL
jgi:hypothetical protein